MNRREFLKTFLAGGAGLALAPVIGLPKIEKEIITDDEHCCRCGKSLIIQENEKPEEKENNFGQFQECASLIIFDNLKIKKMTEISISVNADNYEKFRKRQLGKYEIGKIYEFCWECWLDSLMGV